MSLKAYQGGQFEYLRVLEAQRAVTHANLEFIRALGDAWKAASTISGLALEDAWPPLLIRVLADIRGFEILPRDADVRHGDWAVASEGHGITEQAVR